MHIMSFMYAKTQICIYKLKIFLSLFVNHQQRGKRKTKKYSSPPFCSKQRINKGVTSNKSIIRIYAIYIHEEEDAKLTSLHICIT